MLNRFDAFFEQRQAWGGLVLRVILGVVFLAHGYLAAFVFTPAGMAGFMGQVGIPLPTVSAWFAIAAHLVGGVALLAGLYTRLAALLNAVVMAGAVLFVHLGQGFFMQPINGGAAVGGYEFSLTVLAASVALVFTGPGVFALDALRGRTPAGRPAGART